MIQLLKLMTRVSKLAVTAGFAIAGLWLAVFWAIA